MSHPDPTTTPSTEDLLLAEAERVQAEATAIDERLAALADERVALRTKRDALTTTLESLTRILDGLTGGTTEATATEPPLPFPTRTAGGNRIRVAPVVEAWVERHGAKGPFTAHTVRESYPDLNTSSVGNVLGELEKAGVLRSVGTITTRGPGNQIRRAITAYVLADAVDTTVDEATVPDTGEAAQ